MQNENTRIINKFKGNIKFRSDGEERSQIGFTPPQSSVSANSTICASRPVILLDDGEEASVFNGPAASSSRASGRVARN